jgi:uncharacterized DUF497 family protein
MEFEWDEEKNRANIAKHGIAFEDAIEVFEDPSQRTDVARMVGGEIRLQTLGRASGYAVLLVVHTLRFIEDEVPSVRVISARPASRKERQRYERR